MKPPIAVFWRVLIGACLVVAVIDLLGAHLAEALSAIGVSYLIYRLGSQEREIEHLRALLWRRIR